MGFLDTIQDVIDVATAPINIATGLINYNLNSHSQNKQNDFNLQMYKMQRADTLEDRAHLEDYNSPVKQMQRYRDAGLNTNLIYGGIGSTNTVMPSPSTTHSGASLNNYKYINPNLLEILSATKQMANIDADTDLKKEQANTQKTIQDLNKNKSNTETARQEYMNKQKELISYKVDYEGARSVYYQELARAEWLLNGYRAETSESISDYWKVKADKALDIIDATLQVLESKKVLNYSTVALQGVQAGLYNAIKDLNIANKDLVIEKITGEVLSNGISALSFNKLQETLPALKANEWIKLVVGVTQSLRNVGAFIHDIKN